MTMKKEPETSKELAEQILKVGIGVIAMVRPETPDQMDKIISLPIMLAEGMIDEFVNREVEKRLAASRDALDDALGRKDS